MRPNETTPLEPLQYYELRDDRDKSVGTTKVFFLMLVAFAFGMGMMHIVERPVAPSNEVEVGLQQPNFPLNEVKVGLHEPNAPLNEGNVEPIEAMTEAEVGQCVDDETAFHEHSFLVDCTEGYILADGDCEKEDPDGTKLKDVCCKTCEEGIHGTCKDFDALIAKFSEEEDVNCEILVMRHGCDFYHREDSQVSLEDLCCQTCKIIKESSSLETGIAANGRALQPYSSEVEVGGFFGWFLNKASSWFYKGRSGGSKACKKSKYTPSNLSAYSTLRDGQISCGGGYANFKGYCNARKAIKDVVYNMALPGILQRAINDYAKNIPNQWNTAFCLGNWRVEDWDDVKQKGQLKRHGCATVMVPGDWGDVSVAALRVPHYEAEFCIVSNVCNWSRAFAIGVGPAATSYVTKYLGAYGKIFSTTVALSISTGFSPNGQYKDEVTFYNGDGWYVQKVSAHFYLHVHAQTVNIMRILCKYSKGFKKVLGCNKKQSKWKRKQFFKIETESLLLVEFPSGYINNAHDCLFGGNYCDPISLITDPIFLLKAQGQITLNLKSLAYVLPKLQITAHTYVFKNSWGLFVGGDINAATAITDICNNVARIVGLSCPSLAVEFELWVTTSKLGFKLDILGHEASCNLVYSPFSFNCGVKGMLIAWSFNYNSNGRRRLGANPHAKPLASDYDLQDPEGYDVLEVVSTGDKPTGVVKVSGKNTPTRVNEPIVKGRPAKEATLEEQVHRMGPDAEKHFKHILESKDLMLENEPTDEELVELKKYYPDEDSSEDDDDEEYDDDDDEEDEDDGEPAHLLHLPGMENMEDLIEKVNE